MADETEKQRWERNFTDLLQELRVSQIGVQVLFAFLLMLPFAANFERVTEVQRGIYLVALLAAAFASGAIIAPVAFHRFLFRRGRKPELVRFAHRLAIAGLACLLISMVASVLLVADVLMSRWTAVTLSAVVAVWFLAWWTILPFVRRNSGATVPREAESAAEAAARVNADIDR
ncbi:DUF6328 family protein [Paractinoplanes rishiriensis]|uniref:Uncharacterized protein n=1 Tax=Paractinoplanes rishiriensis TaxID=1050105 RepID=A0A919K5E1_9ACTN|nr:DUF6328 family protein [Actinoplanes rishiriensis]GIF01222.1 hypothetical protein Ari01nite_86860 [Actinoplanes rishiriensis]